MFWKPSLRPRPCGPGAPCAVYSAALWRKRPLDSLRKFDPRVQIRNPVMFVVWVGALVTRALAINPTLFGPSKATHLYNGVVTLILAVDGVVRELRRGAGRRPRQSESRVLRRTKTELTASACRQGRRSSRSRADALRKGDLVRVEKDELIPIDGEVVEGIAFVDESAITGESAPVLKEPGTDISLVSPQARRLFPIAWLFGQPPILAKASSTA